MNRSAPRSVEQYLRQLREELAGEDTALIQDALYDAGDTYLAPAWLNSFWALPLLVLAGVLLLTLLMNLARGVGHLHAMYAKALLVAPAAA